MRIKTGETYTTKVGVKSLVTYTCVNCRAKQIGEYMVEVQSVASASVLQDGRSIANMNKVNALKNLIDTNAKNKEEVNNNHNYLCLNQPFKCSECGTVQPWSDNTEHPVKKKPSEGIITLCLIVGISGLGLINAGAWWMTLILEAICGGVFYYYFAHNKKCDRISAENKEIRTKAIEQFLFDGYELPTYYRREDVAQLMEGPFAAEVIKKYPNIFDMNNKTINWPK